MPIPADDLNRRYLLVAAGDTLGSVRERLPEKHAERAYVYVVWPVEGGRYVVVRWHEIEDLARANPQAVLANPIGALPGLPKPSAAAEQSSLSKRQALELRDEQPGRRLVVLSAGAVVGLLTREILGADELKPDPFTGTHTLPQSLPPDPIIDLPTLPEAPPPLIIEDRDLPLPFPRTLSDDEPAAGAEPKPQAAARATKDTRAINAWVPGVDAQTPMQVRVPYELKFNVAQPRTDAIATTLGVGKAVAVAAAGQATATLMVVVEPGDFTLYGVDAQEIVVPAASNQPSKNTVTFTIEAAKEGPNTLEAIYYLNGNLFQRVSLTIQAGQQLEVGAPAISSTASGLTLVSAAKLPDRKRQPVVNLVIIKKEAGYQFIVQGGGVARAFLNISTEGIADWVANARKSLYELVNLQDAQGNYVYQSENSTIDENTDKQSLKKLAETGALLYYNLFYNTNNDDARRMGDLLRGLSRKYQLHIQIVAERFFFPWSFLFDGDDDELENPNYEQFWGFKHVIEYLPEFTLGTTVNFIPTIEVGDTVEIAFVCNNAIDAQFGQPIVEGQRQYLNGLPGTSVTDYATVAELVKLMRGPDSPPLIYFYCHAISKQTAEDGGVDFSRITMSDTKTTLAEMKLKTRSAVERLRAAPLVFLNACETAELSPFLYDGWVPFLLSRGARGVIGTEAETPAFFAAEFAKEFLRRFTAGDQPVGELLRDLRVEYARDKHNLMGLLYALYSNGEVVIQRAA